MTKKSKTKQKTSQKTMEKPSSASYKNIKMS